MKLISFERITSNAYILEKLENIKKKPLDINIFNCSFLETRNLF